MVLPGMARPLRACLKLPLQLLGPNGTAPASLACGDGPHRTSHPVPAVQKILAYKIQADRFGDLDADTLKVLDRAGGSDGQPSIISKKLTALDQRRFAPPPGSVLVREWDRKSHRVMVMPDGFAWNGKTFESLSQVAFAITGTKWNGPRFFGLRDRQPQISAGDSK